MSKLPAMSQATWHDSIMQSFNLSGESQSNEITAEGVARAKAEAEAIARKAQYILDIPPVERAMRGECFPLHDDTNENAL